MTLVHGGSAIGMLSPSVFNFLSGMNPGDILVSLDEVPDEELRSVLEKV